MIPSYVIAGCWVIFLAFWTVSSFFVKPALKGATHSKPVLVRIAVVIGTLLVLTRGGAALNVSMLPVTPLRSAIAEMLCLIGLVLALWARVTLGRNWSASVTFKRGHELIRTGPYAFVRHPIYTAVLLMIIGTVVFVGRIEGVIILAIASVGFCIKLRAEERLMTTHFPKDYPAYKAHTKALVPFLF